MVEEANVKAAATPLRVCCYGSSSSRTPQKYTDAAYALGLHLARRGHTCVNGAGSAGCMAAMNHGADDGGGRIVGVIHEKFVVDGSDWFEGAHSVFKQGRNEVMIARGNDLQERKRLLVEGADALVVLPGGPGTWDELWEMACARHIGFHSMPIVCVNVDGYYDTFKAILERAHNDELLYKHPRDIVHFEETSEVAVQWIEDFLADPSNAKASKKAIRKRSQSALKRMESNLSGSSLTGLKRMASFFGGDPSRSDEDATHESDGEPMISWNNLAIFSAGLSLGLLVASRTSSK